MAIRAEMAFYAKLSEVQQIMESPSLPQQIEILKQQLAKAQRLTALGELVSTTTHEFNNVLMTILNYAKMGMRHKDAATRDQARSANLRAGPERYAFRNDVRKVSTQVSVSTRRHQEAVSPGARAARAVLARITTSPSSVQFST